MFSENILPTLKVNLKTKVKPNSEENKKDATDKLYSYLKKPHVQKELSKRLSKKLNTELEVDDVNKGCVIIDLRLKDYTELENIKSLSDNGVLSTIFGSLLLTAEYLSTCLAEKVYIGAKVDYGSYQDLMAYATGY